MQYRFDGEFHRLARVTGPTHNFLALRLDEGPPGAAPVVRPLAVAEGEPSRLDASDVTAAVLAGVADANREAGTRYVVRELQFVPADSPPAAVYRALAREIALRAAEAGRRARPAAVPVA